MGNTYFLKPKMPTSPALRTSGGTRETIFKLKKLIFISFDDSVSLCLTFIELFIVWKQ